MIKILYDDKNAFEHFPFYAIFYVKYCIGSIQLYVKTFKLFFKIFVPPETRSDLYNIFYPSENKTFFHIYLFLLNEKSDNEINDGL